MSHNQKNGNESTVDSNYAIVIDLSNTRLKQVTICNKINQLYKIKSDQIMVRLQKTDLFDSPINDTIQDQPATVAGMEENQLISPQENELTTLTHSIIEWRRLKVDNDAVKDLVRERTKKMKALEEIIVRVMKSHNIGALDLKNSGGRVLFRKQKRQAGLGQKTMEKLVSEHLQSAEAATELMKYIQEHREVVIKESIHYEKTD